jgi:hypothetical protein
LFGIVVAETSKGRKGMSWSEAKRLFYQVDPDWVTHRCPAGLSSGEGLIFAVRDQVVGQVPVREGKKIVGYEEQVTDAGITDKRLCVVESELAQALHASGREGNTLSAVLRQAWDGTPLRVMTKNNSTACNEPHVSIIGHITALEIRRLLSATDSLNGFANRFLWLCAARSKCLPFGGSVDPRAISELAARTKDAICSARGIGQVGFSPAAREEWASVYPDLSRARPGLFGAVTARGEAQAIHLALTYSLLGKSAAIEIEHLRAALALWRYSEDSARYIFGDRVGDPTADEILQLLRNTRGWVTRNEIMDHFKRNKSSAEIGRALAVLQSLGLVQCGTIETDGRPAEAWSAVGYAGDIPTGTR